MKDVNSREQNETPKTILALSITGTCITPTIFVQSWILAFTMSFISIWWNLWDRLQPNQKLPSKMDDDDPDSLSW